MAESVHAAERVEQVEDLTPTELVDIGKQVMTYAALLNERGEGKSVSEIARYVASHRIEIAQDASKMSFDEAAMLFGATFAAQQLSEGEDPRNILPTAERVEQ